MTWLNVLLLILISAGHTELMTTLINRVHARPFPRSLLRRFRRFEDAVIVAFPFVVFWFVGWRGPGLLRGGLWSHVPLPWLAYFAICALGFFGLVASTIRWRLKRAPKAQLSNHSQVVDVAERLGYPPLGRGKLRYLAQVPGNEIFRVEVSDKRYRLPRVPEAWQNLSILHLTDTHFVETIQRSYFEEIARLAGQQPPDLVVFTGDLLDDMDCLAWLSETLGQLRAPLGCYYILGNHDWWIGAEKIRATFDRCGWEGVAGRVVTVEHRGHRLEIGGTECPWMGVHPPFEVDSRAFRILLSHTPDHFSWARQRHVDLMLAGHVHGGQVVLPIVGPVFSPSKYGVRYVSGAFWSEPTLLYVSRGLGGRHPLRINCRPELTRIVLESPGSTRLAEPAPMSR